MKCFMQISAVFSTLFLCCSASTALTTGSPVSTGEYQDPFAPSSQKTELMLTSEGPRLWENLLVESTETVSLLAHMVAFSTRVPVSMANHPPTGGWRRVRHPDSLRASIVQLANQVWDSINLAAVNLDEVQQRMKQVPGNIRMSLRVIRRMKLELIPRLLPVYLGAIENAGAKCSELANHTVQSVTDTAELIKELQLGVFSTETARRIELRKAKERAEALKELQKKLEEIVAFNKDVYSTNEERVNKATQKFYKYLDEIPTGWKKLLQDVIKAGSAAFVTYLNPMAGAAYTANLYGSDLVGNGRTVANGQTGLEETKKKIAYTNDDMIIFKNVASYPDDIGKLAEVLEGTGLEDKFKEFETMKIRMDEMMRTWSEDNYKPSAIRRRCENSMNQVMEICAAVQSAFRNAECIDPKTNEQPPAEGEQEDQERSKRNTEEGSQSQSTPCITDAQKSEYKIQLEQAKKKFQQIAAANSQFQNEMMQSPPKAGKEGKGSKDAQFKVAQARMHLQNLLQIQQVTQQRVAQSLENLGNLNAKLKTIDLRKVSLKEVIDLLNQMARALTDMIKLWRNLQQFFYNVQKHAKILKDSARKYADLGRKHSQIVKDGLIVDDGDQSYRREMVYQMVIDAQQVNAQSFMVFTMSKTYVQVAQKHLLRPLGRVTEMFTVTNISEVESLRDDISSKVDVSKSAILVLVREEERKFNQTSARQMEGYNRLIQNYGGESEEMNEILAAGEQIANEVGIDASLIQEDNDITDWGKKRKR